MISPLAYRQLDEIYGYIAENLSEPETAIHLIEKIEDVILSLSKLPERGAERKTGRFANKGYRQVFVGNYTVIYRTEVKFLQVIIIAVVYSPRKI